MQRTACMDFGQYKSTRHGFSRGARSFRHFTTRAIY